MDFLRLPERTAGKRTYGITSVADFGTPIGQLEHILRDYHSLIDVAKIGIGTAYVTPNLKEKVALYQSYGIIVYCGGTLFEKCYHQGKIGEYAAFLQEAGVEWVEVSNGTIDIPLEERLSVISDLKSSFRVLSEVGSKDADKEMPVSVWKSEIEQLLAAGCDYVITEGRDSGTSGIYQKNGEIKAGLISGLIEDLDSRKIIFEAPTPKHQMYFINELGPNVNLGNVKLHDVLVLETQRRGLRSETFHLKAEAACGQFS